jgi:hypothetical protein
LAHIYVVVEQPWEIQGQESSGMDLKAHPSDSCEPMSGVQADRTSPGKESNSISDNTDLLLTAEQATGSVKDDSASLEQ